MTNVRLHRPSRRRTLPSPARSDGGWGCGRRGVGRSRNAVTVRRVARGIPAFSGWATGGRPWTAEEDAILGIATDEQIAKRIHRTTSAVARSSASSTCWPR